MYAIGSISDPFAAFRDDGQTSNTNGRIPRPSRLDPTERTMIFVGLGQSMIAASENENYTPIHSGKVDNLNLYDGGIYAAQDPLLGCGRWNAAGCWLSRFADKLINADICDRVILVPIARGSTRLQDWVPGGFMHNNLVAASRRLAALGLSASAYLWAQGEADRFAISRSDYSAGLAAMIADLRSRGFLAPWMLGKSTSADGTVDETIRGAIDDVINNASIFAGGDHDSIDASGRYDGVHFNAAGANAAAAKWTNAVAASQALWQG